MALKGSPPARGAWIEMPEIAQQRYEENVAPRTGGVD